MGDLGLDQADQEELLGVKGARVEFSSLLDLTMKGTGTVSYTHLTLPTN